MPTFYSALTMLVECLKKIGTIVARAARQSAGRRVSPSHGESLELSINCARNTRGDERASNLVHLRVDL